MGIRGLQFFVENCCPGAYYDVDIRDQVGVYRGRVSHDRQAGRMGQKEIPNYE